MTDRGQVRRSRRSERGFALMEVLIAFTIAAIAVATLMYGVTIAFRSDLRAKANRMEMRVAQSRLEAAGIEQPVTTGGLAGSANGLRWSQSASKAKPLALAGSGAEKSAQRPPVQLYWVEVTVMGAGGREVRLATSKLVATAP